MEKPAKNKIQRRLKMSKDTIPPHIEVRQELMALQRIGGGMFDPFALRKLLHSVMLRDKVQHPNLLHFARLTAQVYCSLANEFFLLNYNKNRTDIELFYVTEERWEKYFIDSTTRAQCIDFLYRYDFISYEMKSIPPENKQTLVYKINVDKLRQCRRNLENEAK